MCVANQMTGFYMKGNTGMKWVNKGIRKYIYLEQPPEVFYRTMLLKISQENTYVGVSFLIKLKSGGL